MQTPGTAMDHTKMFLFFDCETNALGSMNKKVTQTLMQLSWVVAAEDGTVEGFQNRYVTGCEKVGPYAPHDLTPKFVNENGDDPREVIGDFLEDCKRVVGSGGNLIAHNADFDVGVLENALGEDLGSDLSKAVFCTMKDLDVMRYFGFKNKAGALKYPKLSEMYKSLFGEEPSEQLHDALGDSHVLRQSFFRLLELGVISFEDPDVKKLKMLRDRKREERKRKREDPEYVRNESEKRKERYWAHKNSGSDLAGNPQKDCELFVNASDVATLSGLMEKYDQYPYKIAERVLSRFGSNIGASGRICQVLPSEAESKLESVLDSASAEGSRCENTNLLAQKERDMHADIDRRGDITPDVAREAKKLISGRLARSFGVVQEDRVVKSLKIEGNNSETFRLQGGSTLCGVKWGIVGKVDGFSGGRLVEVKTRKKYLFNAVRDYERVQLEIYMRMTGVHEATLIENLTDERGTAMKEHRVHRDDDIWELVGVECSNFFEKLMYLVSTPELIGEWEKGSDATRKMVWGSISL